LSTAAQIFCLAATTNITTLTTAYAHEFYPEDEWRDDLEWGAVELHLAFAEEGNAAESARHLQLATHWARDYIRSGSRIRSIFMT